MRIRNGVTWVGLMWAVTALGCGGSSGPAGPAPTTLPPAPAPTPSATPAPTPKPSTSPTVCPNGQKMVVRFTVEVSWIQAPDGSLRNRSAGLIYVGDLVRFDSHAKDVQGRPTNGCGDEPRWSWEPDELAVLNSTKGWNPKARVDAPGVFTVGASLDGVDSEPLELTFRPAP